MDSTEGDALVARALRAFEAIGIERARIQQAVDAARAKGASPAWREAYKSLPPFSALFAGAAVPLGAYAIVDYLAASCATMAEGIERLARYFALVRPDVTIRVAVDTQTARVDFDTESPDDWFFDEWTLGITVQRFRSFTGQAFPLVEARFRRPAEGGRPDVAVLDFLGCDPVLGARHGGFSVGVEAWRLPLFLRDERMQSSLEAHAERMLREHQSDTSALRSRLRDVVLRALRAGDASVQAAAKALGTTPRTLQRRLSDEGLSYATVVEEIRADLARRYLEEERLSVTEVAFLLGYSEASAFARAYRRWTGKSPAEARRER